MMVIKKISSIVITLFTISCLYLMSKGVIGIPLAYILIVFNIIRVLIEAFITKKIAERLPISDSIKEELPRKVGHLLVCFITLPMIHYSFKGTIHIVLFLTVSLIMTTILINLGQLDSVKRIDGDDNLYGIIFLILGFLFNNILALINPDFLLPSMLGVMCLGLGDVMACFIGKKFGKHKIYENKSIEGVIGFIIGATISMFIFSHIVIWKLLIIATVGAITELYSKKYDNLTIQVTTCLTAYLII